MKGVELRCVKIKIHRNLSKVFGNVPYFGCMANLDTGVNTWFIIALYLIIQLM